VKLFKGIEGETGNRLARLGPAGLVAGPRELPAGRSAAHTKIHRV